MPLIFYIHPEKAGTEIKEQVRNIRSWSMHKPDFANLVGELEKEQKEEKIPWYIF